VAVEAEPLAYKVLLVEQETTVKHLVAMVVMELNLL
jgi:hypothetical protein